MRHLDERPLSEEVTKLIGEIGRFLRLEIYLTRMELSPKLSRVGRHFAIIASGGFITCIGLLFLAISATLGLARVVQPWLAALISGALLSCGGMLLLIFGKKGLNRETIIPEKAVESLQEAAKTLKDRLK